MNKFIISALVLFSACTSTSTCSLEGKAVDTLSQVLSSTLNCASPASVHADVAAMFAKIPVCQGQAPATGTAQIHGLICNTVVNSAVDLVLSHGVPSKWQCSGQGVGVDALKLIMATACSNVIPF